MTKKDSTLILLYYACTLPDMLTFSLVEILDFKTGEETSPTKDPKIRKEGARTVFPFSVTTVSSYISYQMSGINLPKFVRNGWGG
jgi:hypothetical protein